jgi:organic hydroperoxide reductase OsmC/OhrA
MSNKQHLYKIAVEWTGNNGIGTAAYAVYGRSHNIRAAHKPVIEGSSDATFMGDDTKYNPEELFLSSISSCHMLWYLHLCADEGIVVEAYNDNAEGTMEETSTRGGHFSEVVLYPKVEVTESWMIEKAIALHEIAHQHCFIANSCNFPILVQPSCTSTT